MTDSRDSERSDRRWTAMSRRAQRIRNKEKHMTREMERECRKSDGSFNLKAFNRLWAKGTDAARISQIDKRHDHRKHYWQR